MAEIGPAIDPRAAPRWLERIAMRPDIQSRLARVPLLRRLVRREGAELFDLVQGFVRAQVLYAIVDLRVHALLAERPRPGAELARHLGLSDDRTDLLLRAGAGIGILSRDRKGRWRLSRRGAALTGVPGLADMIRHHRAFYADMADPVALLRGDAETELSAFWPYVHGAAAARDPDVARRYSDLMARSQVLVAEDTLAAVSFSGVRSLLDIGGGAGTFLAAVGRDYPDLALELLDLPTVTPLAEVTMARAGLADRFNSHPGSFRDAPIPRGSDAISLVRVLYDHDDATVRTLLAQVFDALPPGGRLIISEPMSGGDRPDPATDVYFAFYTLAMRTGRTRSQAEIATLCRDAGFRDLRTPRPFRAYITAIVEARKP